MKPTHSFARAALITLTIAAGVAASPYAVAAGPVKLTHVHGMSYSADGAKLMIPSHDGMAVFEAGTKKRDGDCHLQSRRIPEQGPGSQLEADRTQRRRT